MIATIPAPPARRPWLNRAVAVGAAVRTARLSHQLRKAGGGIAEQENARAALMIGFATTQFGRAEGIEARIRYADFRNRVAPRSYEAFAPWIERMKRGEADVLWPGQCAHYAVSSGTTSGRTKYLPITPAMLGHFRKAGLDSLCFYTRRVGRSDLFKGKHLFLGGSTSLAPISESAPYLAWSGDLSGITALNLPKWAERALYEPGREIAQICDWPEKLRAIVARTASRNLTMIAGIPSWLLILAEEVRRQTGAPTLRTLWPQLECVVHGGVPLGPFETQLRSAAGPGVNFHEVYPASEGFVAAQDAAAELGLRLIANAGIFYEFIPLAHYDETRLAESGLEAVSLAGVRTGVDYVLLMTTPAGLCRYAIGDVVRFVSTEPPRLIYVGRTRLQLSAFGEHVIEKELTDSLCEVGDALGLTVANFHVAPRFVDTSHGVHRGSHEWFIELKSGTLGDPRAAALALDRALQRLNDDYEAKRKGGGLDCPSVRSLCPGTFELWMRSHAKWGGQNKVPRCRSDRQVADELTRCDSPPL